MRILMIAERFPPMRGGMARSSHRIATGLSKRGVEMHVLMADGGVAAGDMESSQEDGLIVHRMGQFPKEDRTWTSMGRAIELIHRNAKFDALIGMYLAMSGYIAALESKLLNVPSLVMARGNDVDREIFMPARHPFVMGALQMATAVGCVSLELMAKCRALVNREGVHYTPNGVDVEVFSPGAPDENLRNKLGLGETVVGFSGELRFKKGLSHVIAAAEQIAGKFHGAKFMLLGGVRQDDDKDFRQLLEDGAGESLLVETPYIEDPDELRKYYRLMTVLFMPSFWEGMPNACLEAFACGVPAVASTAGGLRELVDTGITGFSFAPGDFNGAVEALDEALSLPDDHRRAMGSLAREKVLRAFTPKLEIERILEILNGIL